MRKPDEPVSTVNVIDRLALRGTSGDANRDGDERYIGVESVLRIRAGIHDQGGNVVRCSGRGHHYGRGS